MINLGRQTGRTSDGHQGDKSWDPSNVQLLPQKNPFCGHEGLSEKFQYFHLKALRTGLEHREKEIPAEATVLCRTLHIRNYRKTMVALT